MRISDGNNTVLTPRVSGDAVKESSPGWTVFQIVLLMRTALQGFSRLNI